VLSLLADLTVKDARLLVGHGTMSADKLRKVVRIALHKDLGDFDPVAEAFKVRLRWDRSPQRGCLPDVEGMTGR
jgi:hypothetical protein